MAVPNDHLPLHHERIRRRGVNPWVYWPVRAILQPFIQVYFRLRRVGLEHPPRRGGVLLAANHRSFLDPFVVGCCLRRPVYFVAKRELFDNRLQGWFLNALGAFPVRRGEADEDMMTTARMLLDRGDPVVIFPEGTRHRRGSLGRPRRGVGRLALETGVPVVPIAITGSERARRGWRIRPVKVQIRLGRPLTFPRVESPSHHLAGEVTARIWPCVGLQWEWLGGLPPLRTAAVVGAGSMGTALATLLARGGLEVQLGCRTSVQAERLAETGENSSRMPGMKLPEGIRVSTVDQIEYAGADLVVFAVPSKSLPSAVAQVGARVGDRSAVLVVSKGLVAPLASRPSEYVAERVRARAIAALGGPAHAEEAVAHGAAVVLASADADLREMLGKVLAGAGLHVEQTDDVVGTELAGAAKNAAALAAAAASHSGPNAAGAVASQVFAEVHDHARRSGARSETFVGLAGSGDLVGTVLAGHSRNRRAGELLGQGVPAAQIAGMLDEAAEGLDTVPLLAQRLEDSGARADATSELSALVEGRIEADEWVSHLRANGRAHAAA